MAIGIFYLVVYAMGLGIPFLAASLWIDHFRPLLAWLRRHVRAISWMGAVLMLAVGLLILSDQLTILPRTMILWGGLLQEWSSSAETRFASHGAATAVYSLLIFAPISVYWIVKRKEQALRSWAGTVAATLGLLCGTTLIVCEWAGTFVLLERLSSWMQYQGL